MIVVRDATPGDVNAIAELHLLAFPGYFLSHLGQRFLRLFYGFFLANEVSHCIVAVDGDRVIGFVAGTAAKMQHYMAFYRRGFVQIVFIVAARSLRDPVVRREIFKRMSYLRLAVAALLRPRAQSSAEREVGSDQTPARLLSIAIHPDHRGAGVGERLTGSLFDSLYKDGARRVGLTVRSDNGRAIAFYKKDGWAVQNTTSEFVTFERDLKKGRRV